MKSTLLGALAATLLVSTAYAQKPFTLVINEDNSHFYGWRTPKEMTVEGLNAFVDQYANTGVSHLFLCPNSMKTSYASNVWDSIWDLGDQIVPADQPVAQAWVDNARILNERGLDPYAHWIARAREKGISPWLSMRMNDVHEVDNPKSYLHSRFWVAHPEYWRVPGSTSGSWVNRAFDYAIPEVRAHHMKLLVELLERYDVDGIELDWMRFGWHFAPGKEEEGAAILNAFMRQARDLTNQWAIKRGHPIQLAARCPTHPDAALGLGMDGVTWAKEGLVDVLVPSPFWFSGDFDIPLELWRERIGDAAKNIVLLPGHEVLVGAYSGAKQELNDLASVCGWANASWARGADALYLFNYMDPAPILGGPSAYRAILESGLSRDYLSGQPCRFLVTCRDTTPPGFPDVAQLPKPLADSQTIRVYLGPIVPSATARIVLGTNKVIDEATAKAIAVQLNGTSCTPSAPPTDLAIYPGAQQALAFDIPKSKIITGNNTITITLKEITTDAQLVWCEIATTP